MSVRISAKAIIIDGGDVLLLEMRDEIGTYFILPGGGQELGENLVQTLQRECLEEVGAAVEVQDLWLVRDYIEASHEFAHRKSGFQQVELMFRCRILDRAAACLGETPDTRQVGVRWLPLDGLKGVRLFPKVLGTELPRVAAGRQGPVYLGDVN